MDDKTEKNGLPENDGENPDNVSDTPVAANSDDLPSNKDEFHGKRFLRDIFDWLETFSFAFAFVLVFFSFIFKVVTVDGESMHYTLDGGDKLVISDVLYEPKYGDIVVLRRDENPDEPIIKRVIATEGQTVEIDFDTWQIKVDGQLLDEPYINDDPHTRKGQRMHASMCPEKFTVGENQVFVLGDNRNNSQDSRNNVACKYTQQPDGSFLYTGFTEDDIMGRVLLRLMPFEYFGKVGIAPESRVEQLRAIAEARMQGLIIN